MRLRSCFSRTNLARNTILMILECSVSSKPSRPHWPSGKSGPLPPQYQDMVTTDVIQSYQAQLEKSCIAVGSCQHYEGADAALGAEAIHEVLQILGRSHANSCLPADDLLLSSDFSCKAQRERICCCMELQQWHGQEWPISASACSCAAETTGMLLGRLGHRRWQASCRCNTTVLHSM